MAVSQLSGRGGAQKKPPRLIYRRLLVAAVVALILLALLVLLADRRELDRLAGVADWRLALLAALFAAISYLSLTLSFAVLYRLFTGGLPWRDLLEIGFVSVALSNMLFLGGAPEYGLRLLLMQPRGLSVSEVTVPSLLHTFIKDAMYVAGAPLAVVVLLSSHILPPGWHGGLGAAVALPLAAVLLLVAVLFVRPLRARLLDVLARLWHALTRRDARPLFRELDEGLSRGMKLLRARPLLAALIVTLISIDGAAILASLYFCFRVAGLQIGVGTLALGYFAGRTAGVLSFAPGGVGVQEASMAAVYSLLGLPFNSALFSAIVFRTAYYLLPFAVSLVFYRSLVGRALRSLDARGNTPPVT